MILRATGIHIYVRIMGPLLLSATQLEEAKYRFEAHCLSEAAFTHSSRLI